MYNFPRGTRWTDEVLQTPLLTQSGQSGSALIDCGIATIRAKAAKWKHVSRRPYTFTGDPLHGLRFTSNGAPCAACRLRRRCHILGAATNYVDILVCCEPHRS